MKKQFISIAAAIAFVFCAGALLAGDGIEAGPETLGKVHSTDGIFLAQSKFDKLISKKERKKKKKAQARERRKRELERELARERHERKRLEREKRERERQKLDRKRYSRRPLRVIKSHLARTSSVRSTRRMSNRVRPGQRVYFYYKVGPIKKHKRRARVKTRLVVRKDGRTVYRGKWKKRNAARAGSRRGDNYVRYYESAQWSYRVARRRAGGRYSATIYFEDIKNRKRTSINYRFTVKKSRKDRGRYDRDKDSRYGRTRHYRSPKRATRYYKRNRYGATKYHNRSRYGGTRYNNRSRYGGTRYMGTRYYKR